MFTLLMKDKTFLNVVLYTVHFGCHGNVNFERTLCLFLFCFVLSIVKFDMDYLEFVSIVNSNLC